MNTSPPLRSSLYECAKLTLMAPVALARVLVIGVIANAINAVCWWGVQWNDDFETFDAVVTRLFRAWCAVASLRVTVSGEEHLRDARRLNQCVVVFNHVSILDFVVLLRTAVFSFVTHEHWASVPCAAQFIKYSRFIFIRSGVQTTATIVHRVASGVHPLVAIAPEGTLSNGSGLLKFKTGAFAPLAPVLPVLLRYPFRHHNPAWTVDAHILFRVYRILTQFVTPVRVEFLPVVAPTAGETPAEFAQRVRGAMAAALNVPLVEQDAGDRRQKTVA